MTQDEIIEMARQAGFLYGTMGPSNTRFVTAIGHTFIVELETFAKLVEELVAAKEREACAKVADTISDRYGWGHYGNEVDTADEIAYAIRARGEH